MKAKSLKELLSCFVKDGIILEKPVGIYEKKNLDARRIKLLREFIDLLLNTDILAEETKILLQNKYLTVEGLIQHLGNKGKVHTIQTRITRDIAKLNVIFGEKMLTDIKEYSDINIERYEQRLYETKYKNTNMNVLDDRIVLKLPKGGDYTKANIEAVDDFIDTIKQWLKSHKKGVEDCLDKDAVAYARKLLGSTLLTEEEQERKEYLELLLNLSEE